MGKAPTVEGAEPQKHLGVGRISFYGHPLAGVGSWSTGQTCPHSTSKKQGSDLRLQAPCPVLAP